MIDSLAVETNCINKEDYMKYFTPHTYLPKFFLLEGFRKITVPENDNGKTCKGKLAIDDHIAIL